MVHIPKIPDKEVRRVVAEFPELILRRAGKHWKVINPKTGGWVLAPVSGSDWRGPKNLRRQLKHLVATGYSPWQWQQMAFAA